MGCPFAMLRTEGCLNSTPSRSSRSCTGQGLGRQGIAFKQDPKGLKLPFKGRFKEASFCTRKSSVSTLRPEVLYPLLAHFRAFFVQIFHYSCRSFIGEQLLSFHNFIEISTLHTSSFVLVYQGNHNITFFKLRSFIFRTNKLPPIFLLVPRGTLARNPDRYIYIYIIIYIYI